MTPYQKLFLKEILAYELKEGRENKGCYTNDELLKAYAGSLYNVQNNLGDPEEWKIRVKMYREEILLRMTLR
jgi:hypothetical protein